MAQYRDANLNTIDTPNGIAHRSSSLAPHPTSDTAPNSNGASGVPLGPIQISVGSGNNNLAVWSNPA